MSYIASENISVFPSALRTAYVSGKLTSEPNLTNIIRCLGKDSFIINWESDAGEIVVHGYYFNLSELPTSTGDLYACIRLDNTGRLAAYDDGTTTLDSNTEFKGLSFENSAPTGDNYYSLQVLAGGQVVTANKIRVDLADQANSLTTGTTGNASQIVYFNNGIPTAGIKINYSTADPESATGSTGDLWFKYNG